MYFKVLGAIGRISSSNVRRLKREGKTTANLGASRSHIGVAECASVRSLSNKYVHLTMSQVKNGLALYRCSVVYPKYRTKSIVVRR